MENKKTLLMAALGVIIFMIILSSAYTVNETQQVIITQPLGCNLYRIIQQVVIIQLLVRILCIIIRQVKLGGTF